MEVKDLLAVLSNARKVAVKYKGLKITVPNMKKILLESKFPPADNILLNKYAHDLCSFALFHYEVGEKNNTKCSLSDCYTYAFTTGSKDTVFKCAVEDIITDTSWNLMIDDVMERIKKFEEDDGGIKDISIILRTCRKTGRRNYFKPYKIDPSIVKEILLEGGFPSYEEEMLEKYSRDLCSFAIFHHEIQGKKNLLCSLADCYLYSIFGSCTATSIDKRLIIPSSITTEITVNEKSWENMIDEITARLRKYV